MSNINRRGVLSGIVGISGTTAIAGCLGSSDEFFTDIEIQQDGTIELQIDPGEIGFTEEVVEVASLTADGDELTTRSYDGSESTIRMGQLSHRGDIYFEAHDGSGDVVSESELFTYDSDPTLVGVDVEPLVEDRDPDSLEEELMIDIWIFSFQIHNDGAIPQEMTSIDIDDDGFPFMVQTARVDLFDKQGDDRVTFRATPNDESTVYAEIVIVEYRYQTIEDGTYSAPLRLDGPDMDSIEDTIELEITGTVEAGQDNTPEELDVRLQ